MTAIDRDGEHPRQRLRVLRLELSLLLLRSVSTIDSLETRPFCRSFAYIQSRKGRGKKGGASKRKRAGILERERKGAH